MGDQDQGPRHALTSKRELRLVMKARVAALAWDERNRQEQALSKQLAELPGLSSARTVLLYVAALPEEPRTIDAFSYAYAMNKRVVCPRVDRASRSLRLYEVSHPATDLHPGALGIPEPSDHLPEVQPAAIDWVLVPGLAFDSRGFRLGRGAGYYDRLIPKLRPDAICWAICLSCQLVSELPVEPHDQPLDGITAPETAVMGLRHQSWMV
jgi:5-formyltetrahydrofolate cyclo-ligase